MIEKRKLGQTGLLISALSIGGIPFQRVDAKVTTEILARAKDLGINFIDTARGYTTSEEFIGEALQKVGRDNFYLATKSMKRDSSILEDLETSLRNLKTDHIDLYQFHNISKKEDFDRIFEKDGAYECILQKKKEGVIGHIGFTSHSVDLLKEAIHSGKFETVQFPYNAVESQGQALLEEAHQKGLGVLIMKPFAGGAIQNKSLALRYLMEKDFISAMIPGIDSIEELEENVKSVDPYIPLSNEERMTLEEETTELGEHFCRRCGYCMPCTAGINIPQIFLFEGYYTRYDLKEWTLERLKGLQKTQDDCIECGVCETRCPYQLPIREMMKNAQKTFRGAK
ncbi:aldo/keto reductase [Guggenheimella bovis]